MRAQYVAILLSSLALCGVVLLALLGPPSLGSTGAALDRRQVAPAPVPPLTLDAASGPGPRLGGPSEEVEAEVRLLRSRVAELEEEVATLQEKLEKLADMVEPAQDLLAFMRAEVPDLMKARAAANATAAIATLRNITSAQAQMQASAKVDEDNDAVGEYAGFKELSGISAGRMGRLLVPPVLSGAFRVLNDHGEASRSGYLFRFYLPGSRGAGIGEPAEGFDRSSGIDPQFAETTWCCYAWPIKKGASRRVFFMNQAGDVLQTQADYAGPGGGPAPDAAFVRRGAITGEVAVNERGSDGNIWRRAR